MKKILLITLEFPPQVGGIATYISDLARALPSENMVVLAPLVEKNKPEIETGTSQPAYTLIRTNLLYPKFFWPRWLKLFFVARRIVRQENIELVMVHHILPVGYVARLLKIFFKIPYIVFSHGTDIAVGARTQHKKKMMRQIVEQSEQIIFNSESLRSRFVNFFPNLSQKTSVIYPCPDDIFYVRPPADTITQLRRQLALEGKRTIFSAGRLVDGKGFPHLIPILADIVKKYPQVVWIIAGSGPKETEFLQLIQKNNLHNSVRFLGEIAHADLASFYHAADMFVLLTHPDQGREEGLGLVFLEAAAAGLPVIAGRSGGVEEAVLHKKTGLLFDVYTQKPEISAAIMYLLENPAIAQALGASGQARMRQEFNWQNQLQKLSPWLNED